MSARLLATFCLVFGCMSASAESELVVYLKADPAQPSGPLSFMKKELTTLMHAAGYRVEWGGESHSDDLVVVELNGNCSLPAGYERPSAPSAAPAAFASTNVTDGQVLPFASVNCATITRSLSTTLWKEAGAQRDFFYGRALARVIAHELYHILMRSTDHSRNGVTRRCFSNAELMADRFEFEGPALAQLRARPQTPATAAADSEDATDR